MYRAPPSPSPFVLVAAKGVVTAHLRATGAAAWSFEVPQGYVPGHLVTRLFADEHHAVLVAGRSTKPGARRTSTASTSRRAGPDGTSRSRAA